MTNGPFKLKGWSGFQDSPMQDTDPHTGKNPDHEAHGETTKEPNAKKLAALEKKLASLEEQLKKASGGRKLAIKNEITATYKAINELFK